MKITLDIHTKKTFEIDSELYRHIEGLEGLEAFNKLIEILGEWEDHHDTDEWHDFEKIEFLAENSEYIEATDTVKEVWYQQRYKVYDFRKHRKLFSGTYEECEQYLKENQPVNEAIEIVEF